MTFNQGLISSNKLDWETPSEVFDYFNNIFSFTLDAAASANNTKCEHFYTEQVNSLDRDWRGRVWLNPPYGRSIAKWVKKARTESSKGALVVCLLKHATETKWWDDIIDSNATVFRIRGRVKFSNCGINAPFPAVAVIFWPYGGLNLHIREAEHGKI